MTGFDDIFDVYADMAFWQQIRGDAARTVLCEPHRVDGLRAAVEARGYGHLITVQASATCPEGQLLVIDGAAMEGSWRQVAQRAAKDITFRTATADSPLQDRLAPPYGWGSGWRRAG
ncbi:hypothetical protein [Streptomyces sp. NPDC004528]|uniref:hypothetical protein n=1 Tax=Streptomyces sp. NPDC004528 TaxID=3154550 RepID=UPI0033A33E87